MLTTEQKAKLFASDPMLAAMPADLLTSLADLARESQHGAGDFIFGRSDRAEDLYFLVYGSVGYPELRYRDADRDHPDRRVGSCRIFGFGAAFLGYAQRAVSALCEDSSIVLRVAGTKAVQTCFRYGRHGHRLVEDMLRAHLRYEHRFASKLAWPKLDNFTCRVDSTLTHACSGMEPSALRSAFILSLVGPCEVTGRVAAPILGLQLGEQVGSTFSSSSIVSEGAYEDGQSAKVLWEHLCRSQVTVEGYLRRISEGSEHPVSWPMLKTLLRTHGIDADKHQPLTMARLSQEQSLYVRLLGQACATQQVILVNHDAWGRSADTRQRAADFIRAVSDVTASRVLLLTEDIRGAARIADRVVVISADAEDGQFPLVMERNKSVIEGPHGGAHEFVPVAARSRRRRPPNSSADGGDRSPSIRGMPALTSPAPCEGDTKAIEQVAGRRAVNVLREKLEAGEFFWTVEFIPSRDSGLRDDLSRYLRLESSFSGSNGIVACSVTDRVHSDDDPDPTLAALSLKQRCGRQPIVHFSGKDRELSDLSETLWQMEKYGLENMLFLSGDRLKDEPKDRRVRYLESVAAIRVARAAIPSLLIGAALNPFKYSEEETLAQYLKLGKKVGAGIDFAITQIGYDFDKYSEALQWVRSRRYDIPLIANVMPLSVRSATFIRKRSIPGITITDSLMQLLEADEQYFEDRGVARVRRRLALQVVGLQRLGYAGVQFTGIHSSDQLAALAQEVASVSRECPNLLLWRQAWSEALTFPGGERAAAVTVGSAPWYLAHDAALPVRRGASKRYRLMNWAHEFAFDRGALARLVAPVLKAVDDRSLAGQLLLRVERTVKGTLLGCESCGMCRLAATQYVCPETCPKGLANGPCGGTRDNRCEFGDRECIHSVKYRKARDAGVLPQLETWLIPAVPAQRRGCPSWAEHFRGNGPQVEISPPSRSYHSTGGSLAGRSTTEGVERGADRA